MRPIRLAFVLSAMFVSQVVAQDDETPTGPLSPEAMADTLRFLCSDEMAGRDSPSVGGGPIVTHRPAACRLCAPLMEGILPLRGAAAYGTARRSSALPQVPPTAAGVSRPAETPAQPEMGRRKYGKCVRHKEGCPLRLEKQ